MIKKKISDMEKSFLYIMKVDEKHFYNRKEDSYEKDHFGSSVRVRSPEYHLQDFEPPGKEKDLRG